ncbi:hypothetical protein TI39_contig5834g00004 [Zymoseptoria brevis]|uniref:Uncharacterized protein n=1 Tax=Zymoseptoria brevis TaxID=1047168 RepID=A0A0F4G6H2_9PEZI|nr:hypothetical protein TI39_contig5834g00004 [Zymoseptoria brevis]
MLLDNEPPSSAYIVNLFSYHHLSTTIDEPSIDLFLRLHLLDCRNALTCIVNTHDPNYSPFGGERCRFPLFTDHREFCLAFNKFYDDAEDAELRPRLLQAELLMLIKLALCREHAHQPGAVEKMFERMWVAVVRWQCRRIFKETPAGRSGTPIEERPASIRLSRFFSTTRNPGAAPQRPRVELDPSKPYYFESYWDPPIEYPKSESESCEPGVADESEAKGGDQKAEEEEEEEEDEPDIPFPSGCQKTVPHRGKRWSL